MENSVAHHGSKNKPLKGTSWACWASQKGGERQSELWSQHQQVSGSGLIDDKKKWEVAGISSVPVVSLKRGFLSPRALTGNFLKAFNKTSIVKTFFLADSATYASGLTKTTNREKKKSEEST